MDKTASDYSEILVFGPEGYLMSHDKGQTWKSITSDEVAEYYARYENTRTTSNEESARMDEEMAR
jgi:hypothetical protein